MLAPDTRAVLLDQLRPPEGYQLDAAVATTFTLDLPAALVPPLAFASFAVRSTTDPVSTLEAVRSCADRVDVFCQAGMVRVPKRYTALFAFLEPMLHDVVAPPGGLFHPKLWLLRYRCGGLPDSYRLLCLSRNLTEDHSWDLTLRLDATRQGRPDAANRPLSALIRSLPATLARPMPAARRERVLQLAEDARHLEWELPDGVNEMAFHAFGVNGVHADPDFSGYRHLVVSPFLNDAGLKLLTPASRDVTVVSRATALEELSPDALSYLTSTYVISTVAGLDDGETGAQDVPIPLLSGLHAKLVVAERNKRAHVFLGSANATDAALTRNVEILVELVGGATKLGIETMLAPDSPFLGMLEPYDAKGGAGPAADADAVWAVENALRALASRGWVLTVRGSAQAYALRVDTDESVSLPSALSAQVEPLAHPGVARPVEHGTTRHGVFDGVPLLEISPYLTLRVWDNTGLERASVVRAELRGDPDGRLDEVLASQIDTPEKFLRFLSLLLGLGHGHPLANLLAGDGAAGASGRLAPAPQVFEVVVRALAQNPGSIDDLDRLVRRMQATASGQANLPVGFTELWDVVTASRRQLTEVEA